MNTHSTHGESTHALLEITKGDLVMISEGVLGEQLFANDFHEVIDITYNKVIISRGGAQEEYFVKDIIGVMKGGIL